MQQSFPNRLPTRLIEWIVRNPYTLVAGIIFIALGVSFMRKISGDWDVTYLLSAGHLCHGQSIYHNGDGYIYPPFPSLFALPFWLLPAKLGKLAWYLATVAGFVLMTVWSWRLAGGPPLQNPGSASPLDHLAFILALIPGATYASNCISHSQTDIVIGCAIVAGCVALTRGKSLLAATLYGLAAAMKGPALIWFPYLIARRKPLGAIWMIAVFIGVNLAPNLIDHRPTLLFSDWVHDYLAPKKTAGNVYPDVWSSESNQSLMGSVTRWTTTRWEWTGKTYTQRIPLEHPASPRTLKIVMCSAYAVLLATLATSLGWWPKKLDASQKTMRPALEFSLVAILMLVCSPMAAKAQWGILMLPGFCLARLCIRRRDPVLLVCFCAGWIAWIGSQNFLRPNGVFVGLWYGAVLWNAVFWFAGCAFALVHPNVQFTTDSRARNQSAV
jgi:hypothetical protein